MSFFKERVPSFQNTGEMNDWLCLFYMQHYGVPTRLLDWTENALIAIHFALMDPCLFSEPISEFDAVLWILSPDLWNRNVLKNSGFSKGIIRPGSDFLIPYQPNTNPPHYDLYPVAIFGYQNSARIAAQQGVFTLFGSETDPMEKIITKVEFTSPALWKLIIPNKSINEFREEILSIGITETVAYPDISGLAAEIKRRFTC